jgi:hypothetical protein
MTTCLVGKRPEGSRQPEAERARYYSAARFELLA